MTDYGSTPPPPGGGPTPPGSGGDVAPPPPPAPPVGQVGGQGYDGGAYGAPAPSYQAGPVGAAVEKPKSIALAVKLMYAGAVLAVLSALTTLLQIDTIRDAVEKAAADSGESMSASTVDATVAVSVGFAIFVGVLGALLWIFMAVMNGKGKKWARIVATVFFGISVLVTLGSLAQETPVLSRILSLISLVLGGYIIFLLFRPDSSQYYDATSAPRV